MKEKVVKSCINVYQNGCTNIISPYNITQDS